MKDEYDFSNAEQGKFYRPPEELDIPIYLDKEVKDFFINKIRNQEKPFSINDTINSLLKKDIEISNQLTNQGITRPIQPTTSVATSQEIAHRFGVHYSTVSPAVKEIEGGTSKQCLARLDPIDGLKIKHVQE